MQNENPTRPFLSRTCMLAIVVLIAGCGQNSDRHSLFGIGHTSLLNGAITTQGEQVSVHADHAPDAVITATGDLSINLQAVTIDAVQRGLLQHYYSSVLAVREHGLATGKAGATVAGQALKSVAEGLASGNTDQIDKQVDAKAAQVEQAAMKICQDLADIKSAQDALAPQLAAFKPYAQVVADKDIRDCRKD